MTQRKPILCLDFDGVIHSYTTGWKGAGTISDPPVEGVTKFIAEAVAQFTVAIYSARSSSEEGLAAMQAYVQRILEEDLSLERWEVNHVVSSLQWPTSKPPALLTIDDRALTFTGVWPTLAEISAFKPWNKK